MTSWQMNKQCDECPWRSDVAPGRFSVERFEKLRGSVQQGFAPMFACHKTPECNKMACVGYVINQVYGPGNGPQNFNLRRALSFEKIDPERMTLTGPQYLTYDEMVAANAEAEAERDCNGNGTETDGESSCEGDYGSGSCSR